MRVIDAAVDRAAFHLMAALVTFQAALTHRASRHLCSLGFHNEVDEGAFITCEVPGCEHIREAVRVHG